MRARWRRELDWKEQDGQAREDLTARNTREESPSQIEDTPEAANMKCNHPREVMSDLKHSDSDTVFITYWCPDCRNHRTDEMIGSLARAMDEELEREAEREINAPRMSA